MAIPMLSSRSRAVFPSFFSRPKLNWIVPDQLAAMSLPTTKDLRRLRRSGVTLLVSVVSTSLPRDELARAHLKYLHLPVKYLRAPTPEQIATFVGAAQEEIANGGKVVVHCIGGIGRTGTVLACYLVNQGMTPDEAMAYVREKRPGSIESLEQENAIYAWALERAKIASDGAVVVEAPPDLEDETDEAEELRFPEPEQMQEPVLQGEGQIPMARAGQTGYLKWHPDGSGVDVRALFTGSGSTPQVEHLKSALKNFTSENGITVTLTETLGQEGEAWISVACSPGEQGALLMTAGKIIDLLVKGSVYEEVLLSAE